jgi:two-component system OmpR family sensor kinase
VEARPATTVSRRRRTRVVVAGVLAVAGLYTCFVVASTHAVGPATRVPLPGLSRLVYLQDALDVLAAAVVLGGGAVLLDRLLAHEAAILAREQALQATTLGAVGRLTALARRITETAAFETRLPTSDPAGGEAGVGGAAPRAPPDGFVGELAGTFNTLFSRLEAAVEAQRRLVADTAHELRNPLTVLRTNLALVQREDADAPTRQDAARDADEEAARLGRLVDDLLLLSRGAAGDYLRLCPLRLDGLLAEVAQEAREAPTGHTVALAACHPATVLGDQERLRQVLRNVIGNALQHTPAGTRVRLRLVCADGRATVLVADTGPGIAAAHLPRVFERFYRADGARSRAGLDDAARRPSGAGLGLAIVRHLVEAHGGTVSLTSEVGAGTTARLTLPLLAPDRPARASPPGQERPGPQPVGRPLDLTA